MRDPFIEWCEKQRRTYRQILQNGTMRIAPLRYGSVVSEMVDMQDTIVRLLAELDELVAVCSR